MRLLPVLTSVIVAFALYALVFERDLLLSFAGRPPADAQPDAAASDPAPATSAPRRVAVTVMDSVAETAQSVVALRGQTEAFRRVEVQSETSGRVVSEPLRRGAAVAAGDTLCQLDPGTRPAQLDEAEARLAEAKISNTAAARLAEGGFGSETRAAAALATLSSARAAVAAARTELERLIITAPFDGVLDTDTAELGSLMQPGAPCATILQLDPMRVVGYVPETRLDAVRVGAPAQARLADGQTVQGGVSFLARAADPATRTFRVEITVPNPDGAVRDGQSTDIAIAADGTPAHRIPSSALTLDDAGTMGVRVVDPDNIARFVPVKLLRDTVDGVLVTGLPDKARIITVGQEFVTDGVAVRVMENRPRT
jgi:multidrug efflux system membrane fusion protein